MYSSSLSTIPTGIILNFLVALCLSLIIWLIFKLLKKDISLKKLFKNFSIVLIVSYMVAKISYYILQITHNLEMLYMLGMLHIFSIIIMLAIVFSNRKKLHININK